MPRLNKIFPKVRVTAELGAGMLQPDGHIVPATGLLVFQEHLRKLHTITKEDFPAVAISRSKGLSHKEHLSVAGQAYNRDSFEKAMEAAVIDLFKQTQPYKASPDSYTQLFHVIDASHARDCPDTCGVPTLLEKIEEIVKAHERTQVENNTAIGSHVANISNNNATPGNPGPGNSGVPGNM